MSESVLITGFGALTASGTTIDETWDAVKNGKTGLAKIKDWDVDTWDYQIAGELKEYNPRTMVDDRKLLKVLSKQDVIGLNAAKQAIEHSGMRSFQESLPDQTTYNDRTAVIVASAGNKFNQQYDFMPLMHKADGDMKVFAEKLFGTVHPMWLLRILPNNVLAYTGIQYGFKGPNQNITNHAVSSIQALIEASNLIKEGVVDRAIVVGYDTAFEPQQQVYYGGLGVLSEESVKSFDKNRDGTILGDGAAAFFLESETSAKERNATVYGEVLGGSTTSEAKGVFQIDEEADGLIRSINTTLEKTNLSPNEIGMVTAHANGTRNSDATEALALTTVFGKNSIPVTGFKWNLGHTLAAAGMIETLLTLMSLREKTVPGIPTIQEKASECESINVSCDNQTCDNDIALVISRAFGSLNSTLALKAK